MAYFVKAVGIAILVMGVIYVVRPQTIRGIIEFFKVGRRIYVGAGLRIAIGILLLLSIKSVALPWIPGVIGAMSVVSGGVVFFLGLAKGVELVEKVQSKPDATLRWLSVIPIAVGMLLIYSA